MQQRLIHIVGTGTDVGKTYVTEALVRAKRAVILSAAKDLSTSNVRASGEMLHSVQHDVIALKPVLSGWDPASPESSDSGRLLAAMGMPITEANLTAISPWRLRAPLSPHLAAEREGVRLSAQEVAAWVRDSGFGIKDSVFPHPSLSHREREPEERPLSTNNADDVRDGCIRPPLPVGEGGVRESTLLLEGAGGIMSPLNDHETWLDVVRLLPAPVLLVAGDYLGTFSHTLTAVLALRSVGAEILGVVVNEGGKGSGFWVQDAVLPHLGGTASNLSHREREPDATAAHTISVVGGERPSLRPPLPVGEGGVRVLSACDFPLTLEAMPPTSSTGRGFQAFGEEVRTLQSHTGLPVWMLQRNQPINRETHADLMAALAPHA